MLCKSNGAIKDDIYNKNKQNKELLKNVALLNNTQDSLENTIAEQNDELAQLFIKDSLAVNEIKRLRKNTLNKEYEKAAVFSINYTSDSIIRYFSNL